MVLFLTILLVYFVGYIIRIKQNHEKQLLQKQIETQDSIKKELASELHSGAGSELMSIIINLENKDKDNKFSEEIERIREHYKTIRSKSHLLSIPSFTQTSIKEEINDLIRTLKTESQNINCNIFPENGWAGIHPIIQQSIYRITQELFTNTIKHANASEINIQLTRDSTEIILMYKDNGSGYNPKEIIQNLGYKNEIINRIINIKGSFADDSQVGSGAELSFTFPLNYEK